MSGDNLPHSYSTKQYVTNTNIYTNTNTLKYKYKHKSGDNRPSTLVVYFFMEYKFNVVYFFMEYKFNHFQIESLLVHGS